jgi:hypothetical protein
MRPQLGDGLAVFRDRERLARSRDVVHQREALGL